MVKCKTVISIFKNTLSHYMKKSNSKTFGSTNLNLFRYREINMSTNDGEHKNYKFINNA